MIANLNWIEALAVAFEREPRAVLVTVADARGSTPRDAGATMVVTASGSAGTIGGGHLEYEAMRLAREALTGTTTPSATWLVRFPLAARLGQCCGGVATLALSTVARDDASWLAAARTCLRTQAPFALGAAVGSGAPAAARLIVSADDARGTLFDAALESAAIAAARARLGPGNAKVASGAALVDVGAATLVLQIVRPVDFNVLVFGNGHVGRALVHVLGALPARIAWVDSREADFPEAAPPNVEIVCTEMPETEIRAAPSGSYVLVMTHSHAIDFDIVAAALARDDFRYIGMIGSAAKRMQLVRRLAERGLPPEAAARVTCPIGAALGAIASKEPGAIAIAVAAEILALRESSVRHFSRHTDATRTPSPKSGV